MAIRFITGLPGGGKSMTAVQTLLKELRNGKREIVTNLALYPGMIWSFLKAKYGVEVDLDRITILDDDQIKQFYLHRGRGWGAPQPKEKKDGGDGRIDYSSVSRTVDGVTETKDAKGLPKVLYMIEEAHVHFGSRQWQDTAQSALFYLSQHRHLGDEVFFITQHVEQTDKALRRLTQEFWRLTNYGSAFPFGVKLPDYFVVDVFTSPPGLLSKVVDTHTLKLDVEGLCGCYDTAAGVGMAGGLADTTGKRKGIPWQLAITAIVVLMLAALLIPLGAGKLFAKTIPVDAYQPRRTNAVAQAVATNTVATTQPSVIPTPLAVQQQPAQLRPVNPNEVRTLWNTNSQKAVLGPSITAEKPETVKFFIKREGFAMLGLHSGETFSVADGRLQIVGRLAIVDGYRVYKFPE